MDIRRFGPGHRRADGPPGTTGISGQVIWSDERSHVSEMAFSRRGLVAPHSNPNTTLFVVVSGGGWVQVGDERLPVNHGQAVVWPAGVTHGAWTDGSEMRAIVVELATPSEPPLIEGVRVVGVESPPGPGRGALADRPVAPAEHDESHGEPW